MPNGTKIKANASKNKAVSYKRAEKKIRQLELEVKELSEKADQADNRPLEEGLSIPDEIKRRKDRIAKLNEARRVIEERYEKVKEEKHEEYEEKIKKREEVKKKGKKPRGKAPSPPSETPPDKTQFNFTDPESRIMKAGNGSHFDQCYNAQAAVDTEGSLLILGHYVSDNANDKKELPRISQAVKREIREVDDILADSGYFSERAIKAVEKTDDTAKGPTVYCALKKEHHHKSVQDLEKKDDAPPIPPDSTEKEKMLYRLQTKAGRTKYKKRKETVEPVFGIIKSVMGFRSFSMRSLDKVSTEWDLVTLSYNLKRLHKLMDGIRLSAVSCNVVKYA